MGYIHRTASQFIPPYKFQFNAGTWYETRIGFAWIKGKQAADETFTAYLPVLLPSCSLSQKGAYLTSIEVMYSIVTAAADDFATVALYKDTLAVTGTLNTAASVDITMDAAHDSAAERKAIKNHRMVATLDVGAWIDNNEAYHLEFVIDCAAATSFFCVGALVNYTLRL
jgi:hypothetical protein